MIAATADRLQMRLGDLLGKAVSGADPVITGLTMDSREVVPGSLFLACSGSRGHGLDHLSQAVDRGAAAVAWEPDRRWDMAALEQRLPDHAPPLVRVPGLGQQASLIASRFHGDPSADLWLVGVTGTNGKTSCTQFLAQALADDLRCGIIGTVGNGFPGALVAGSHTTPDPVRLQALLADFLAQGAAAVAMEVSSHALDQGRTGAVRMDVAVLTNLSRDHLDYHGDMAAYAAAKKRLFQSPGLEAAILNLDDALGRELALELADGPRLIGYSRESRSPAGRPEYWIHGEILSSDDDGMQIGIGGSWGQARFATPLLGDFNLSNLLAVLGVLLHRGVPLETAVERLQRLQGVPGRMQRFGGGSQPLVVVDYAHTPDALEQVLRALRGHARGRLICVFGCGGDRDRGKRPQMGAIAEALSDLPLVTDDNPRTEDGDRIVDDILAGMRQPGRARVIRDRGRAIHEAVRDAAAGDLVLVAGKGHETTQQVGETRFPFSDARQVLQALQERPA